MTKIINAYTGEHHDLCPCEDCAGQTASSRQSVSYSQSVDHCEALLPKVIEVIHTSTPATLMMIAKELQCMAFVAATSERHIMPTDAVDILRKMLSESYQRSISAFMRSLIDYPDGLKDALIENLKSDEARERGIYAYEGPEGVPPELRPN